MTLRHEAPSLAARPRMYCFQNYLQSSKMSLNATYYNNIIHFLYSFAMITNLIF